ncbi:MAG: AtpZ/AtpI family protein [Thermogutta sp.]
MDDSSRCSKELSQSAGNEPGDGRCDTRSALAKGWAIGSEVVAISLQFALPLFGGFLLDRWLGLTPAITILGAVVGSAAAILGFVAFIRRLDR